MHFANHYVASHNKRKTNSVCPHVQIPQRSPPSARRKTHDCLPICPRPSHSLTRPSQSRAKTRTRYLGGPPHTPKHGPPTIREHQRSALLPTYASKIAKTSHLCASATIITPNPPPRAAHAHSCISHTRRGTPHPRSRTRKLRNDTRRALTP